MQRHAASALLWLVAALGAGCGDSIRPSVEESDFGVTEPQLDAHVAFVCSDAFRSFVSRQKDPLGRRTWTFDLGPAAADSLGYHLRSHFKQVETLPAKPAFPVAPDIKAVLSPNYAQMRAVIPIASGTCTVALLLSFNVYDPAGNVVYCREYLGRGKQEGSTGETGARAALPLAARQAIREATDSAVHDLALYVRSGVVPGSEDSP